MTPVRCFIGLGSNMEQPSRQIEQALNTLAELDTLNLVQVSPRFRTPAVGPGEQPDYCNAVAEITTTLSPHALLDALQRIERQQGRVREAQTRWLPRTLDLDILLYDRLTLQDASLEIPHPRMQERGFVLQPLCAIAPEVEIPGLGKAADICAALAERPLPLWADDAE